jgi:prevent-host-death family protein
VNLREAKTHFSRLIDAAHAGETIVVAKGGRPWARLMPLPEEELAALGSPCRHCRSQRVSS